MNQNKGDESESEDGGKSPEMELVENGGEALPTSKARPENEKATPARELTGGGDSGDRDEESKNSEEARSDDGKPEGKEKTDLNEKVDQIEHGETDKTDEDWYEGETFEYTENKKNKKKYIFMSILLGVIAAAVFFLWFTIDKNRGRPDDPPLSQQAEQTENNVVSKALDVSFLSQEAKKPETTSQVKISEHTALGLVDKLEKATRIRNELLKKQEEIRALKQYYRNKIKEVEDEILKEKREEGIITFQEALKSKQIELGLRTISRRHLYIHKLNRPLEQLHRGSEEILYIKRLAEIQIQMAPVVNGIDIGELGKRIDVILEKEASGVDSLTIDTGEINAPSLKKIWKGIVHKDNRKKQPEKETQREGKSEEEKVHSQQQGKINDEVWQEICAGNLSRKHELTKLSLNAAKCLSQWEEGKDLFLNDIKELPDSIAGQLSQWGGEWLCLNGLTELSPESAEGLSHWQGIRLSLNGLIELVPEAAKHLFQWRGKQIEVMGLAIISSEAEKYLSAWQKAGGKLYIRALP